MPHLMPTFTFLQGALRRPERCARTKTRPPRRSFSSERILSNCPETPLIYHFQYRDARKKDGKPTVIRAEFLTTNRDRRGFNPATLLIVPALKIQNSQVRIALSVFSDERLLRPDAFAGEGDIIAGSFLDQVHGLVGHAQNFSVGAAIARECG